MLSLINTEVSNSGANQGIQEDYYKLPSSWVGAKLYRAMGLQKLNLRPLY